MTFSGTDNMSRAMSRVAAAYRSAALSYEYDGLIDGGEWSGPATSRWLDRALETIADEHGFENADEMFEHAGVAATPRWVWSTFGR